MGEAEEERRKQKRREKSKILFKTYLGILMRIIQISS